MSNPLDGYAKADRESREPQVSSSLKHLINGTGPYDKKAPEKQKLDTEIEKKKEELKDLKEQRKNV